MQKKGNLLVELLLSMSIDFEGLLQKKQNHRIGFMRCTLLVIGRHYLANDSKPCIIVIEYSTKNSRVSFQRSKYASVPTACVVAEIFILEFS